MRKREIKIEVAQDAVEKWRVPIHQVVEEIKNRNIRATGGSDPFSAPMALAMGYGILFTTPLSLLLLPCMMVALEDRAKFRTGLSIRNSKG